MMQTSSTVDVTLVTHRGLPEGAPDDVLLANKLREQGLTVNAIPWDEQTYDWRYSRVSLVRSTWDYHAHPRAWEEWVQKVSAATRLLNPPGLLRWNTDKRYLLELIDAGVPCICTVDVTEDWPELHCLPGAAAWIVKPAVGASSKGVRRFIAADLQTEGLAYVRSLRKAGAVLLQPFIPDVLTTGERALVFLGGEFSHAYTKPAFSLNSTGTTPIASHSALGVELDVARKALACAPSAPLYARVDLIPTRTGPVVMEMELIEPDLGLRLDAVALSRVAGLVSEHLGVCR